MPLSCASRACDKGLKAGRDDLSRGERLGLSRGDARALSQDTISTSLLVISPLDSGAPRSGTAFWAPVYVPSAWHDAFPAGGMPTYVWNKDEDLAPPEKFKHV